MSVKTARPHFLDIIMDDLAQVEVVLSEHLKSDVHTVADVSSHILNAGGKRLRPALALLSAFAAGSEIDSGGLVSVAAAVEMVHMATLMHDDVIDSAASRRGRATANSHWGNQVSVLAGDYAVSKAFWLLSVHGNEGMMCALASSTISMAEGELRQIEAKGDIDMLVQSYFPIIEGKTAAFMSACCRIGAIAANAGVEYEDALASYGRNIGMAFQITDDILDLVGDPDVIGKPVGGDIREGKVTLPVILAMEDVDLSVRGAIERIVYKEDASEEEIDYIRRTAEATGAIDGAREVTARYIRQAIENLEALPAGVYRDAMDHLARYILSREL